MKSAKVGAIKVKDLASHLVTWSMDQPFYEHDLTLAPAGISNYMPRRMWGEITYPL